jgi:hypothetical protein
MNTKKLAILFDQQEDSVRSSLCRRGHFLGLVPVKLPNGRLFWRDENVYALLGVNLSNAKEASHAS